MDVTCFLTILLLSFFADVSCNCVWSINKDLPRRNPIYLKRTGRKYELYYPNATNIVLKTEQSLVAVCNGPGNYVYGTSKGKSAVNVTCESGQRVRVEGRVVQIKDVNCTKDVAADVFAANKNCAGRQGKQLDIGFNTTYGRMDLFSVCFDFQRNIPLYVTHVLRGKAINGSFSRNDRLAFKASGLPKNISWTTIYKRNEQFEHFKRLLGPVSANAYFQTPQNFMDRGHLAPDADFIFNSMQLATYFYANAVPQWQSINRGNWVRIENAVRRLANHAREDLTIVTGTLGVLQLANDTNRNTSVFLAPRNNVPAPKYVWKVVCDAKDVCISLIVLNNPYFVRDRPLCEDICERTRWSRVLDNDAYKGAVICCDVKDLNNTVRYIPIKRVTGILSYPLR